MLLRAVEFAFITFGINLVIAFLVAALIKTIATVIQRGRGNALSDKPKS